MAKYYNQSYLDYLYDFSMPVHLFLFITILILTLSFSWYINYENKFEDLMNQVKLFFIICPLLLLVLVHCLSSGFVVIDLPEKDTLHRAGGSPWGVAFVLVFLFFMLSYQSSFHERWFPLVSK